MDAIRRYADYHSLLCFETGAVDAPIQHSLPDHLLVPLENFFDSFNVERISFCSLGSQ